MLILSACFPNYMLMRRDSSIHLTFKYCSAFLVSAQ